jgi:hypothetical protein
VLDAKDASEQERRATRAARLVSAEGVLEAIRDGERTWERLHAFFPETEWKSLARELEALQRAEQIWRCGRLDFHIGARRGRGW